MTKSVTQRNLSLINLLLLLMNFFVVIPSDETNRQTVTD